jgi:protein-L-isoaspartate(D-aspartate) O-methyltransferase
MNYEQKLINMLETQIVSRGIDDPRVLEAIHHIPRHLFVPENFQEDAYDDHPISLPEEYATISQPYMVAYMTEALQPGPSERVLEIGTGSGYQSAVLSFLCREVYSLERHFSLSMNAMRTLQYLGIHNVHCKVGDGLNEWQEKAPFDKIIVTAATRLIPQVLVDQLNVNGSMIIPLGEASIQTLTRIRKKENGIESTSLLPCVFVPLVTQTHILTDE